MSDPSCPAPFTLFHDVYSHAPHVHVLSRAVYSYEHVPNVDTHEGCVSVFAPTNAFPAASTPVINSQNTKAFPFVLTLATNPASQGTRA